MLPTSRNRTYGPASPVVSGDLDDLQDAIIAMKFPAHWRWFGPPRGLVEANTGYQPNSIHNTGNNGTWAASVPLPLPIGTLIDGIAIIASGPASPVEVQLWAYDPANPGGIEIADLTTPNLTGAETPYSLQPGLNPYTTVAGSSLGITVNYGLANQYIYAFGVHLSRL